MTILDIVLNYFLNSAYISTKYRIFYENFHKSSIFLFLFCFNLFVTIIQSLKSDIIGAKKYETVVDMLKVVAKN